MGRVIDREQATSVTVGSGDFQIGAVEIKDADSDVRAQVTNAGLAVDINDPIKLGAAITTIIDGTERTLDATPLASSGYPIVVELEARDVACYIRQGAVAVSLGSPDATNVRILEDDWRMVTIDSVNEAYFAVKRESGTASGILSCSRIDSL